MAEQEAAPKTPAQTILEAIEATAASFISADIATVKDLPKRAQMLVALVRAHHQLVPKPTRSSKKPAAPPLDPPPAPAPALYQAKVLTEAEWEAKYPPRFPRPRQDP